MEVYKNIDSNQNVVGDSSQKGVGEEGQEERECSWIDRFTFIFSSSSSSTPTPETPETLEQRTLPALVASSDSIQSVEECFCWMSCLDKMKVNSGSKYSLSYYLLYLFMFLSTHADNSTSRDLRTSNLW